LKKEPGVNQEEEGRGTRAKYRREKGLKRCGESIEENSGRSVNSQRRRHAKVVATKTSSFTKKENQDCGIQRAGRKGLL